MVKMGMGFKFQMGMRMEMGMIIGVETLKWKGFGTKNSFPHISSRQRMRYRLSARLVSIFDSLMHAHTRTCFDDWPRPQLSQTSVSE